MKGKETRFTHYSLQRYRTKVNKSSIPFEDFFLLFKVRKERSAEWTNVRKERMKERKKWRMNERKGKKGDAKISREMGCGLT